MIARSASPTSAGLRYTAERDIASNRHCRDIGSAGGAPVRPAPDVPPGTFAELSCQKIVFYLQLADLSIQNIDPRFREGRLCASPAAPSATLPPSKTLAAPSSSCFFQL